MLDDDRMFDVLAIDLDRLDAVDETKLDRPVAACPGWTALDVLAHLGVIHRRLVGMLVDGEPFAMLSEQPLPPPADEVVAWRREMSRALYDALRTSDLDASIMTFLGPGTVRVWLRRMMQELAIHRWDVEAAIGSAAPLDPDVGVDSVDELFDLFVGRLPTDVWAAMAPDGASLHVHAIDAPGEWLLRLGPDGLTITAEHAKADVAVRGPASDLALVLWSRPPATAVEVFGATDLLDRFLDAATF